MSSTYKLIHELLHLRLLSRYWLYNPRISPTFIMDLVMRRRASHQQQTSHVQGFWLGKAVSLTDGQHCKKFESLPALQNASYCATDMCTWEMQTPKESCKAEGNRKISIRLASFTGTRNTILRRSHSLGAKQALMWMLALSQLTSEHWELINLYSTGSSFCLQVTM